MPIPGAGHDYQHLLGETVNFSNGSVSFKVSFPVARSRGITLPYAWTYNSAAVNPLDSVDGNTPVWDSKVNHPWPQEDGWNIYDGLPWATVQVWSVNGNDINPFTHKVETGENFIPCNFESGMTFTDSDGVTHNLNTYAFAPAEIIASGAVYTCPSGPVAFTEPPTGDGQVVATLDPLTGSQYLLNSSPTSGAFSVMDKNGTMYQFSGGYSSSSPGNRIGASSIIDRNGNFTGGTDSMGRPGVALSGNPNPTATQSSTVTATVNQGQTDQLTYTSTWNTTSVDYTVALQKPGDTGVLCTAMPAVVGPQYVPIGGTEIPGSDLRNVLSSLDLPNGQNFTLFYGNNNSKDSTILNPYGLLNEVIYPDGGWVKYTWQLSPGFNEVSWFSGNEQYQDASGAYIYLPQPFGCGWQYQTPVLATREVSFDGHTVAQTQTFAFTTNWQYASNGSVSGWTEKTTTVVTTDNLRGGISSKTVYTYTPYSAPQQYLQSGATAPAIPMESSIAYYDWGQTTLLKTVTKKWADQFNLANEITALYQGGGPPRVSETAYKYESPLCSSKPLLEYMAATANSLEIDTNPVGSLNYLREQDDYDFGTGKPGPLVKKTLYNYNCFNPPFPGSGAPVSTLPPQVSNVTVEDGNGNIKTATQYGFDGGALTLPSKTPVIQSLPSYSAKVNSVTVRGNVTSIVKCNPLPATPTSACSGPTTTFAFDTTGQPTSIVDPNGNPTQFSFKDSFTDNSSAPITNSYLTTITYPPINGVSLTKNFNYSYWLGYLTDLIDENGQQTGYIYNTPSSLACGSADGITDGMDRLSEVDYPDNGRTYYCYNDTSLTSTKKVLLNSTPEYMINVALSDGMGHTTETYLTSDPDGTTTVDTAYDGEGKVLNVSNPYRGTGPSSIVTKQYYDALGRKVWTTEQDGNPLQWCYNGLSSSIAPSKMNCSNQLGSVASTSRPGTWVDFTDERGNSWERSSDVFGNLLEVMEPNGSTPASTMETDYSYDVLDNLTAVAQFGGASGSSGMRARAFSYDSLSRLISSYNPETGTIGYTYDLNSNVKTRTDARNLVTQYGYDALNRLLSKTYLTGTDPSGTPASCYQYGASSDSINFTGGRLINAWTQTSQTCLGSPTTYITLRAIKAGRGGQTAYDAMGRLKNEQQYTLASQATGVAYAPQYTYDLAGELTSSTDGITPSPTAPGTPLTFASIFANTQGGAGRVLSVSSNWSDSAHPSSLFFQVATQPTTTCPGAPTWQYYPFGGLSNANFGASLTLNRTYDVRLRTSCELDQGTGTTAATPGTATITITGAEQSK